MKFTCSFNSIRRGAQQIVNMMHNNETEDLDMTQSSGLISEKSSKDVPDIPFCGCLSVRYYQPYFDVDTEDVKTRIAHAFIYCKREQNFLALIGDRPDLYGPFWVNLDYFRLYLSLCKSVRCEGRCILISPFVHLALKYFVSDINNTGFYHRSRFSS